MTATGQTPPTRVVLVDDHPLFRRGLAELLNESGLFEVVADFDDGAHLLESLLALTPELVIVDWQMPKLDGLTLMRHLKQRDTSLKVVLLTASDDSRHLLDAIQQGADGYLLKDTDPERILERLQAVVDGKLGLEEDTILQLTRRLQQDHHRRQHQEHSAHQAPSIPSLTAQPEHRPPTMVPSNTKVTSCAAGLSPDTADSESAMSNWHVVLTERERDTLKWIGRGLSNKLIARELGISDSTVKVYVKNLLRKLHLHSRLELAAWVYAHPLTTTDGASRPLAETTSPEEKESLR